MEWTASGIALVVSTTATALAALSGVAVPVWMNAVEKRVKRREDKYAKAAEAIYFCVENVELYLEHRAREGMRLAFLKSGTGAPDAEKEDVDVERDFQRRMRATQLLAHEAGVDFSKFNTQFLGALSAVPEFTVDNGRLVEAGASMERIKKKNKALDQFVIEGAELLKAFRKTYGLS